MPDTQQEWLEEKLRTITSPYNARAEAEFIVKTWPSSPRGRGMNRRYASRLLGQCNKEKLKSLLEVRLAQTDLKGKKADLELLSHLREKSGMDCGSD